MLTIFFSLLIANVLIYFIGKELPSGWEELFDEVEGTPYFYNESLNKTVWDRPQ